MADEELNDAIKQNATGPAQASGDSGSMQQHKLQDQIDAARFLANEQVKRNPFAALKYAQDGNH